MKRWSILALCVAALICMYLFKNMTNVAEVLQGITVSPAETEKKAKKQKKRKRKKRATRQKKNTKEMEAALSFTPPFVKEDAVYNSQGVEGKVVKDFIRRTYLEITGFESFNFSDFSEDNVAIIVGKNPVGDKLTVVASRMVPKTKDIINLLSNDPDFLGASDPNFRADLMKPLMSTGSRNGFADVQIWKSTQNGKDYYMFFAPRADGKGSYGVLLDGKRENLEANEDYYEQHLLQMRARDE